MGRTLRTPNVRYGEQCYNDVHYITSVRRSTTARPDQSNNSIVFVLARNRNLVAARTSILADEREGNEKAGKDYNTIYQSSPLQLSSTHEICLSIHDYDALKNRVDTAERLKDILESS